MSNSPMTSKSIKLILQTFVPGMYSANQSYFYNLVNVILRDILHQSTCHSFLPTMGSSIIMVSSYHL